MSKKLFIHYKYDEHIEKNIKILNEFGITDKKEFINKIIELLNKNYDEMDIIAYDIDNKLENGMYSGYVVEENNIENRDIIFFTPINTKIGNVMIEQSVMPTILKEMNNNIDFLLNKNIKKIMILTSKINNNNEVKDVYNYLQKDVTSLNTLNFDVLELFHIKKLALNNRFNSIEEYIDISKSIQSRNESNKQIEYFIRENNIIKANFEVKQVEGQFSKSYCFWFLTAMLSGDSDLIYKFDIKMDKKDQHFENLRKFIEYFNNNKNYDKPVTQYIYEVSDEMGIGREPKYKIDNGKKRYIVNKKIKEKVLQNSKYMCACHNEKHFYFESINLTNYVEGHHLIPLNRQSEYYNDNKKKVNLDNEYNIVCLCPTCHKQIHLGSKNARLNILKELYKIKEKDLKYMNKAITLQELSSYYNIFYEDSIK